ncbi:hypothetical protein C8R46DRAFT_1361017 [Mycena filopes]|nr:hypothetical protein C8R46DRAFT_1361017 [Mycena filopes]
MANPPSTAPKLKGHVAWLTSTECHPLKQTNFKLPAAGAGLENVQADVVLPPNGKFKLRFLKEGAPTCLVGLYTQEHHEPLETQFAHGPHPVIFHPQPAGFYKGSPGASIRLHVLQNVGPMDTDLLQRLKECPTIVFGFTFVEGTTNVHKKTKRSAAARTGSVKFPTAGASTSTAALPRAGPSSAAAPNRDPMEELEKETARLKVLVTLSVTQAVIREFEREGADKDVEMSGA